MAWSRIASLLTRCVPTATFDAPLSQGVDERVKTIYYPPRCSKERHLAHQKDFIVNRKPSTASTAPVMGLCAFVRVAMSFSGQCGGYRHALHLAVLKRPVWEREDEDQVHPGEGSA